MRFCSTIPSIGIGETPQIGTIKEIRGNRSSEINELSSLASLAFRLLILALLLASSAHRAPCRGNAITRGHPVGSAGKYAQTPRLRINRLHEPHKRR